MNRNPSELCGKKFIFTGHLFDLVFSSCIDFILKLIVIIMCWSMAFVYIKHFLFYLWDRKTRVESQIFATDEDTVSPKGLFFLFDQRTGRTRRLYWFHSSKYKIPCLNSKQILSPQGFSCVAWDGNLCTLS